jgi:hypothetical protein
MTAVGSFDPLALMVVSHAVSMIAEEMGAVLERGALSPNIRERRDASSALFDARGRMIAQAAHIPVHLGAMPESVRAVMAQSPEPGDVFLLNDPYAGGSHLPDLTMVEAIGDGTEVVAFAAVRAHHADVGLGAAFIGNGGELHAGGVGQHLAGQVRRRAGAEGGIGHGARLGLGFGQHVLEGFVGPGGRGHQD